MANFVIVLLALVALVKSDVGIGYRYQVPVTSYDAPSGAVGNLNDRKYYHVQNHFPTGSIPVSPSSHLQTPIHEHAAFVGSDNSLDRTGSFTGTTNNFQNLQSSSHQGGISTFNLLGSSLNKDTASGAQNVVVGSKYNSDSRNAQVQSTVSTLASKSSFASQDSQQVQVDRHLYFYAAPEEPEEVRTRIVTPPPPAKKNVKILFIKTPTFNAAPISIPVLPQNEDKTLVYVLVKKPEESSIVIPTPAPTKPSKPEVYFIKYNTQKEAQDAVSNIHGGSDNSNVINGYQDIIQTQDYADQNQNINLVSKSADGTSGSAVTEAPILISTSAAPISFGGSGSVGISGQSGSLFGTHTQESPATESQPQRVFSSDAVTAFDGSVDNRARFEGTTTAGSLIGPTVSSKGAEGINVHQVYGPPALTSKSSEDIQVHQLYGPPRN